MIFTMEEVKDFVGENQRILDEWRDDYVRKNQPLYPDCKNLGDYFTPDGIMFKGDFFPVYKNDGSFFRWARKANGNENAMWDKAPLRILYLTKDQNTSDDVAWDVKSESFRYRSENYPPSDMYLQRESRLYINLVYTLYGILNTTAESKADFDCFADRDSLDASILEMVDKSIFARINCKKEVGYERCSDKTLEDAINNDKDFLKRQITLLDADIFICCGFNKTIRESGNHMLNFLNTIGYNFKADKKEEWIYYDEVNNKIAINSYHLSYLSLDYEGMIEAYFGFLKVHPTFTESHR